MTATQMDYNLNTFYIIFFSILTFLMIVGLIFYLIGHLRTKNLNSFLAQTVVGSCVVFLIFIFFGQQFLPITADSFGEVMQYLTKAFRNNIPTQQFGFAYNPHAALFFHMLLPAIAVIIVAGAVAERLKFAALIMFAIISTIAIFPPLYSWLWGKGFLFQLSFIDEAGAGLIYLAGSVAGLTGILLIGPRQEKYSSKNHHTALPGSNIPQAVFGLLLLWIGSLGFNAGVHTVNADVISMHLFANLVMNTVCSSAAGLIAALIVTRLFYGTIDLTFIGNGLIAGMCAIAADPTFPSMGMATLIGGGAAILAIVTIGLIEKMRIDDPAGVIGSFGASSIWGLLVTGALHDTALHQLLIQALGIGVIIAWVGISSTITWIVIRYIVGLRINEIDEIRGLDVLECGVSAYAECAKSAE